MRERKPLTPLRRALHRRRQEKGGEGTTTEDPLGELENSLNKFLASFEQVINKSECSMCKELVGRIRGLPLEEQQKAIPELRRFMALAESSGSEDKLTEALKGMPALVKVMD